MTERAERVDLENLAQLFEQGVTELDRMQGRAIKAFTNVIVWWADELKNAHDSDNPADYFLDVASMLAFQIGAVLGATLCGQPEILKRKLVAGIIANVETRTGEDLLPTRDEVEEIKKYTRTFLN